MLHRRFIYSLVSVGLLALLFFVVHQSFKDLARSNPKTALAAVDQTDPALVGWWKFDEGSGSTAADSSSSGHNGTINGTPSWVAGAVGAHALNFDGTSNSVETTAPSSLNGSSVFTVTFWAKPTVAATFGGNAAVSIRSGTNDNSTFYIASDNSHGGYGPEVISNNAVLIKGNNTQLVDGNFHFYTFVSRSATDHELFVDGVSEGTSNMSFALPGSLTNITIGARYTINGVSTGSHGGPIDDVRVYTRALSSDELSQLYALGTGSSQTQQTGGTGGSSSDTTAPSTPTNLSASVVSSSQVNLTWTASTDAVGVTGYKIYRNNSQVGTSATNSYSDTGLTASTQYSYTVAAYDAAGNTSSQSSSASATTQAASGGSGGNVGGPGAGAHNLYVDQTLANDCTGTYSIANRNCSGSDGYAYKTLQEAADNSSPGNTVMLRGGTYRSVCVINQCSVVIINNSGSAGNVITYEPYNNESVTLYGIGFSDLDSNNDGNADGPLEPLYRETMIKSPASYVTLTGIEVTNSEGGGIEIDGSYDTVQNVTIHDNWEDNIDIGLATPDRVQNDTVNNIESYRSHHGAGMGYGRPRSTINDIITNITIENSLFYENGYWLHNGVITRVMPAAGDTEGGGNSWGVFADDSCSDDTLPAYPNGNVCPNIVLKGNVSWLNVDSSYVPEANTLLLDNIAFANGLEGDGIKVFDTALPNVTMVGNIIYDNIDRGVELRTSGNSYFINNLVIDNGGFGIWGSDAGLYNNISYQNQLVLNPNETESQRDQFCLNGEDCTNNLAGVDPMFYDYTPFKDSNGNISVTIPTGLTIAQKVAWMQEQFRDAFSLKPGSPAIDIGKIVSYTDPITGQSTALSYYGSAPDAGPYEYQVGQIVNPPAPVQDTTPPVTQPANNPPPATNNPAPPAYVPPASTGGGGGGYSGGGGGGGVTPASVAVSNVAVSGTLASGITVTWTTNGPASSQILYGLTSTYGSQTAYDPSFVTSHAQKIMGLQANSIYHIQVRSKDAYATLATSPDMTFVISQNGSVSIATPTSTVAPVSNPLSQVPPAAIPQSGSVRGWLILGTADSEVKSLQELLNAAGYAVAPAGSTGSSGHETTYFGPATESALERFQCARLQVCAGSPATTGYGATGPRTRAALDTLGGSSAAIVPTASIPVAPNAPISPTPSPVPTPLPSGSVTTWLVLGTTNAQVQTLQELLNATGFAVSTSGAGSPGHETAYFGPATQAALRKFQCAKLQVCAGDPATTGYGATGPRTRAALGSSAGGSAASAVSTPAATNSTTKSSVAITSVRAGGSLSGGVVVAWITSGLATSQVQYGTDTSYGLETLASGALTAVHNQTLSGLKAGQTYHYSIVSHDSAGLAVASSDHVFQISSDGTVLNQQ